MECQIARQAASTYLRVLVTMVVMFVASPGVAWPSDTDEPTPLPDPATVQPILFATGLQAAEGPAFDDQGNLYVVNYRRASTIGKITPDGTARIHADLIEHNIGARRFHTARWLLRMVPMMLPILFVIGALIVRLPKSRVLAVVLCLGLAGVLWYGTNVLLKSSRQFATRCNGLKVDDNGCLVGADTAGSQVIRIAADGKSSDVVVREVAGERLRGINDVALDRDGNIYVSNPQQGRVLRWNAESKTVTELNTSTARPNGLAVTPCGKHVVYTEPGKSRVMILDIVDGEGTNQRELISFEADNDPNAPRRENGGRENGGRENGGRENGGRGNGDGVIFDESGRLYVAMPGAGVVHVIEVPSGQLLATYDAGGGAVTNLHFYNGDLFVTDMSKEAIFRLPLGIRGWKYSARCGS